MIFRVKYLVAGVAPAGYLYSRVKSELEGYCRFNICDVYEAEVLGPYPEEDGRPYPVIPVTFKIETNGYDSESTILFDIYSYVGQLRRGDFLEEEISVGIQEITVDGDRREIPDGYLMELPIIEL
jgi:hypothetical protein